jgi:hypothetical protein
VNVNTLPSLSSYFRCPDTPVDFGVDREVAGNPGFFRFGPEMICYGKSSTGHLSSKPDGNLYDVSQHICFNQQTVLLPFGPEEVIRNLREERYVAARQNGDGNIVRDLYYMARPWMPLAFRKYLQRIYLRGWDKLQFPKWPVDRTVDELLEKLLILSLKSSKTESIPFIWFWPDGANACAVMTHDVEATSGKEFCPQLMDIDDSFGIPASFQIVPESRYSVEPEFLAEIRRRGFEINVQDLNHDGRLFQDRKEFERRAKAINRYGKEYQAVGFRSAVLYRNQEWFNLLDFEYDMSVPCVAHLDPQRGGCCTVMPYFVGGLLELPVTTTQDHTLFNVLHDFTNGLWEQQSQYILKHHGLMNFIVHPDYILGDKAQSAYKNLLGMLVNLRRDSNVWIAHPREVNSWWRQRDQMTLTRKGEEWAIQGDGGERARIAFASLDGDRLVYSFAAKPKAALGVGFGTSSLSVKA